jgi:hypothetical protein
MIMEEGLQFRFNFAAQQQEAQLSPVTQKDEKRQDASAITTKQWILPPPPLSVEVFPAKVSQLAKVPSCQVEFRYPSATENMVERADSNWK